MSDTWDSSQEPDPVHLGPAGWLRFTGRALMLIVLVFGGLLLLLALRLIERPLFGLKRPMTPFVTQAVCRCAFVLMGMGFEARGEIMRHPGAVVANHGSWLDIFTLNAKKRIYFVSKSEVAKWPGIGWLARATGTVFIERNPAKAREQTVLFEQRLLAGHKLLFFPEGTSTDGLRVLPFKTTLFAAFFSEHLAPVAYIQPVSVCYVAPKDAPARFYGWWGDMEFAEHLIKTLGARRQGRVVIAYHSPLKVSEFSSRKALARAAEDAVRAGHSALAAELDVPL